MASKSKSGGGKRKIGRNKKWCQMYAMLGREESNRTKRIARHKRWMERKRRRLERRRKRAA